MPRPEGDFVMKLRDPYFIEALYVVFLAFCLVAISSCAHHNMLEKRVNEEVRAEPRLAPGPELAKASGEILFNAPGLSAEQRKRVRGSARSGQPTNEHNSRRNWSAPISASEEPGRPQSGRRQIKLVRQQILSLEKERMNLWLDNLDEAKRILGRRAGGDERLYRAFLLEEPGTQLNSPRSKAQ